MGSAQYARSKSLEQTRSNRAANLPFSVPQTGCPEVATDCLECPLSHCRLDFHDWYERSVRRAMGEILDELPHRSDDDVQTISRQIGGSKRWVYRHLALVKKPPLQPVDPANAAIFRRIAVQRIHQMRLDAMS